MPLYFTSCKRYLRSSTVCRRILRCRFWNARAPVRIPSSYFGLALSLLVPPVPPSSGHRGFPEQGLGPPLHFLWAPRFPGLCSSPGPFHARHWILYQGIVQKKGNVLKRAKSQGTRQHRGPREVGSGILPPQAAQWLRHQRRGFLRQGRLMRRLPSAGLPLVGPAAGVRSVSRGVSSMAVVYMQFFYMQKGTTPLQRYGMMRSFPGWVLQCSDELFHLEDAIVVYIDGCHDLI